MCWVGHAAVYNKDVAARFYSTDGGARDCWFRTDCAKHVKVAARNSSMNFVESSKLRLVDVASSSHYQLKAQIRKWLIVAGSSH